MRIEAGCRVNLRAEIETFKQLFGPIRSICPHGDSRVPGVTNQVLLQAVWTLEVWRGVRRERRHPRSPPRRLADRSGAPERRVEGRRRAAESDQCRSERRSSASRIPTTWRRVRDSGPIEPRRACCLARGPGERGSSPGPDVTTRPRPEPVYRPPPRPPTSHRSHTRSSARFVATTNSTTRRSPRAGASTRCSRTRRSPSAALPRCSPSCIGSPASMTSQGCGCLTSVADSVRWQPSWPLAEPKSRQWTSSLSALRSARRWRASSACRSASTRAHGTHRVRRARVRPCGGQ